MQPWTSGNGDLRRLLRALSCLGALALIGVLDLVQGARSWPLPVVGLLDEPAHLATAALFLVAFLPARARAVVPWALAGAVLIDLDHLPFYLWGALTTDDAGRPLTHSLATVLVLATAGVLAGALTAGRARTALVGLALGVALHLVRDLGTGPGVPLWWPVSGHGVLLPYVTYAALTAAVAVVAGARLLGEGRDGRRRASGSRAWARRPRSR